MLHQLLVQFTRQFHDPLLDKILASPRLPTLSNTDTWVRRLEAAMQAPFTQGQLSNGVRYVLSQAKTASVLVYATRGARHEPHGKYGLAHFTEHELFRGTTTRSTTDLAAPIYRRGGSFNANTAYDLIEFYCKIGNQHVDVPLQVFSDMWQHSTFEEKTLQVEKGAVVNEIQMHRSQPRSYLVEQMLQKMVFAGTSLEHGTGGEEADIAKLDAETVRDYARDVYRPDQCCISIHSARPSSEVVPLITRRWGAWQAKAKSTELPALDERISFADKGTERREDKFGKSEAWIGIACRAYAYDDPRIWTLRLLGVLLAGNMTSRLFLKLRRDRGLVYAVHDELSRYRDTSLFALFSSTTRDEDKIRDVRQLILDELDDVAQRGVSEDEVQVAKDYLIATLNMSLESSTSLATWHGHSLVMTGRIQSFDALLDRLARITRDDVQAVARECFERSRLHVAILT